MKATYISGKPREDTHPWGERCTPETRSRWHGSLVPRDGPGSACLDPEPRELGEGDDVEKTTARAHSIEVGPVPPLRSLRRPRGRLRRQVRRRRRRHADGRRECLFGDALHGAAMLVEA